MVLVEAAPEPVKEERWQALLLRMFSGSRTGHAVLRAASAQPGKLLADPPRATWATLCLAAFESASPLRPDWLDSACVGLEIVMTSLDLLDDLEDGELAPELARWDAARLTNAATLGLFKGLGLVQRSSQLAAQPDSIGSVLAGLEQATCGQARDLEPATIATPDDALAVVHQRSGSLGRLVAECGAILAGSEVPAAYGAIGFHLANYGQLINDLHDVFPHDHKRGDLAAGKRTYPILMAAERLGRWPALPEEVDASGALVFTWAQARRELAAARQLVEDSGASTRFLHLMPTESD